MGVPDGAAIVAGTASAVTLYWSELSPVGVMVDALATVSMRGVMRLLVNVWVSVVPTTTPEGAVTVLIADVPLPKTKPVNVVAPVPPRATERVPVVPATIGRSVALVNVADDGVPKAGVTRVGLVANTKAPVPVSSVTVARKLSEEGVAKNVATPAPKPATPVDTGKPVAFVNVALEGVPRAGVTSVGLFERTALPEPVDVVTPVPPLTTCKTPDVRFEMAVLLIFTKSDPLHAAKHFSPAMMVTPVVGPAPRSKTEPVPALMTM